MDSISSASDLNRLASQSLLPESPLNTNFTIQRLGSSSNNAPVLRDTNVSLGSVNEDALAPNGEVGTLISAIVAIPRNVTDKDTEAMTGIAVTGLDTQKGSWWFTTDKGNTWNGILSAPTENTALLLADDGSTRIYFQPTTQDYNGKINNALSFRAWDSGMAGSNGLTFNTSTNGGSSPFSTFIDTASIQVNPVNDAPINTVPTTTAQTPISINEDNELVFSNSSGNAISFSDIDAGTNSISVTLTAVKGTLALKNSTNSGVVTTGNRSSALTLAGNISNINAAIEGLIFKPTANYTGNEALITVISNDKGNTGSGGELTATSTIYINVDPINDAPTFTKGINQVVSEDADIQPVVGWATNISTGSSDESDQTLAFKVTTTNSNLFDGAVTISPQGTLTYKLAKDAFGKADVTVVLEDDGDGTNTSASQTFVITVNPVNDAPINNIPTDPQIVNEDTSLVFSGDNAITISDIDAGTNPLQVKLTSANGTLRVTPNAALNIQGNNTGSVTLTGTLTNINTALNNLAFKPTNNFNGDTSIIINTNDQNGTGSGGARSDEDTITVKVNAVNDVPTFTKGNNQVVNEDAGAKTVQNWATNISKGGKDESEQIIDFFVENDNFTLFTEQPKISADGTLTYTLANNANGVANVNVSLQDNGGDNNTSATQTFTITVNPVNDAPVNTVPLTQIIDEDKPLVFSEDTGNAITINDIDATDSPVRVTLTATKGTLTVGSTQGQGLTVTGDKTANVILLGSQTVINGALNGLIFKPSTNYNGAASITVLTDDLGKTGSGGARQDSDTIAITINPINDAPFFTKGSNLTVNEDAGVQTVTGWATKISKGASDESAQTLEFIVENDNNSLFAEQPKILPDGTLSYKSAQNANGIANVTVSLKDNGLGEDTSAQQTFSITVNAGNDAPVNSIPTAIQTLNEDDSLTFSTADDNSISISDIDADINPVEVTISSKNGDITLGSTDQLTVVGDGTSSVTLTGIIPNINNALEGLKFQPRTNFNGDTTIQIVTNDKGKMGSGGELKDTDNISIKVNPINDAPTFTKGSDVVVQEDAPMQTIQGWATAISVGAGDEATQVLTFDVSNDNNALFAEQPKIATNGTLTYKTAANANGSATVTVLLKDSGGTQNNGKDTSAPQTFTITVNPVNDAPVNNVPATLQLLNEDSSLTFSTANSNLISISDVDGTTDTLQVAITATNGTLTANNNSKITPTGDGSGNLTLSGSLDDINAALNGLKFTPTTNFNGTTKITIVTTEQGATPLPGSDININVAPVNDAPTVTPGTNLIVVGTTAQTFKTWATFSSEPANESAQTVAEYIISSNSNPELFKVAPAIDSAGNLTFTPAAMTTATTATIGVKVKDSGGIEYGGVDTSVEKTFTITVNPLLVNISAATAFVNEGNSNTSEYSFTVSLSSASTETVTVNYATADDTATTADKDYVLNSGILSFAPGETSKTIKVLVIGDTKYEADQTFKVNLSSADKAVLGTATAMGTIKNDDNMPVISIANVSKKEGNSGTKPLTFNVSLSNASEDQVTVDYAVIDGTATSADYATPSNTVVTFAPGQTSQTIAVDVKGDTDIEVNETFQVNLSNPSSNATIATNGDKAVGTIINDDGTNNIDFDGDGNQDLVWRNYRTGENAIWQMNGTMISEAAFTTKQEDINWKIEAVADFTGDGKSDLLWRNYSSGENEIWQMNGGVRENVFKLTTVADKDWKIEGTADFNGDRMMDIVWRNYRSGENAIWQMNGTTLNKGTFLTKVDDSSWTIEQVGDFNGDRTPDLLWRNYRTGENAMWFMNQDYTFNGEFLSKVDDINWKIQGVGDFNNDGKMDIVWRNYGSGENALWQMNGAAIDKAFFLPKVENPNLVIEQVTDLTGDGKPDIVWRNYSSGENTVWRMNGTSYEEIISLAKVDDLKWEICP